MDFSAALQAVKDGKRVRRALWREIGGQVGEWLEIAEPQLPDGRKMVPLPVCQLPDGRVTAFGGTGWDLLADDWEICD